MSSFAVNCASVFCISTTTWGRKLSSDGRSASIRDLSSGASVWMSGSRAGSVTAPILQRALDGSQGERPRAERLEQRLREVVEVEEPDLVALLRLHDLRLAAPVRGLQPQRRADEALGVPVLRRAGDLQVAYLDAELLPALARRRLLRRPGRLAVAARAGPRARAVRPPPAHQEHPAVVVGDADADADVHARALPRLHPPRQEVRDEPRERARRQRAAVGPRRPPELLEHGEHLGVGRVRRERRGGRVRAVEAHGATSPSSITTPTLPDSSTRSTHTWKSLSPAICAISARFSESSSDPSVMRMTRMVGLTAIAIAMPTRSRSADDACAHGTQL